MDPLLPILWASLGVATIVAAIRSRHGEQAVLAGRVILSALFVGAGALVNLALLLGGEDYADFAEGSFIPFVRETWASLVVPNVGIFIPILIAFETFVGITVLMGRRWTQAALVAAIGFHVALMAFGVGFFIWSVPMIAALATLLRRELRAESGVEVHHMTEMADAA
jgi:hypothetical protein